MTDDPGLKTHLHSSAYYIYTAAHIKWYLIHLAYVTGIPVKENDIFLRHDRICVTVLGTTLTEIRIYLKKKNTTEKRYFVLCI